ncbi:MAG TPA: IMP dehydrogenase [Candidatus Latescibacteria bacterium]|nr:IMP dehydrogenase [Gemmatimonadota bacterium]MBB29696.1 IMP dehydrogenase [Gemmatimonadota bacterium]HCR18657.1 IMP dehydrogenase [Candidatus Latescibacterota bacterium]|tara:strand:+ start:4916 stop:6388 length:1473 start_codon:yes stop_codon:yes gene_type:complete
MDKSTDKIIKEGLTYGDILLVPGKSEVLPKEVDLGTRLTNRIRLNIPLVSAAMDTVTEARLAVAMAQEGGIGVVHKNLTVDKQAEEVEKVKRSESGMIVDPVTLSPEDFIHEALELMSKYRISGVPIVDRSKKLVGILTNRDLRFEKNVGRQVADVMTQKDLVTARLGISLEEAQEILQEHRIEKLPVVDGQDILKGLITVKDIEKKTQYPNACKDDIGRLRVGAAVGVGGDSEERIRALVERDVDVIVVDTAHGHSHGVLEAVEKVKTDYPDTEIVAGNIATGEAAKDLISAGADAIKVGMGPSAICTTRVIAGVGIPQITAIMDCVEVAQEAGVPVIADGGVTQSGDIAKAIAAGANSVMIGYLFAGTDESPGETVIYQGRTFKVYRGMGSLGAMQRGSKDRYFQGDVETEKLVPEGIEGQVPYKGSISGFIYQLVGGLRAGMGYCGTRNVEELRLNGKFVKVTSAGVRESHAHDISITKEAPNYRLQ